MLDRFEEMRIKAQQIVENETADFMESVGKIIDNTNNKFWPSVNLKKEMNKCYITYHITQYPNCKTYYISRYKKYYPFSIYYSKEWTEKNNIPKQYKETFEKLEKYFK